jgi:hypothetical protein
MVAFATMHAKERAAAKPFQRHLEAKLLVPRGLDTDRYGTFSGEIQRKGTMLDAAREKARLGARLSGLAYGLASEGSFGQHPHLPFVAADTELMLFLDESRRFEIAETLLTFRTNYSHTTALSAEELSGFLAAARFPSHAVIVRSNSPRGGDGWHKGIHDLDELRDVVRRCASQSTDGRAAIQTDMRACQNPTRTRVIRALATRIAIRLARCCPRCESPGFGSTNRLTGRPCAWCGEATPLEMGRSITCGTCGYEQSTMLASEPADPASCERCNP